jgi:hypothetical protein
MRKFHSLHVIGLTIPVLLLTAPALAAGINKSIKIEAGGMSSGASTVNGSISVGRGATVTGSLETVNGAIRVDDSAAIKDAETVNGSVTVGTGVKAEDISSVNGNVGIGKKVTVVGEVTLVNGRIGIDAGSTISKDVSNVNGEIEISGAEIGGNLSTVNGDVSLVDGAHLHGNLTIERQGGMHSRDSHFSKPKIIIGPGSTVEGMIIAEREVELYISDSARVGGVSGVMSLEQAVRFKGERP